MGNRRKIGTISAMAVLQLVAQTAGSIKASLLYFSGRIE
jgi:hypothetical protein